MLRAGGFALSARAAPLPAGRILFMPGGRREFVVPPILQRGVSWLLFLLCWVPDACHRTRHTECGTGSSSPARMRVHALRLEGGYSTGHRYSVIENSNLARRGVPFSTLI
jgi:hypothetical protein